MKIIATLLLALSIHHSQAQEISGIVLDERKEPLPNAVIQAYQKGILKGGCITDFDGYYSVKPLAPGLYDMLAMYTGYDSVMIKNVDVSTSQGTRQNFTMAIHIKGQKKLVITPYKKPLIESDKSVRKDVIDLVQSSTDRKITRNNSGTLYIIDGVQVSGPTCINISCGFVLDRTASPTTYNFTKKQIDQMPWTNINDLITTLPGVYQSRRGDDINIFGSRTDGNVYFVDGVRY